MEVVVPSTCSRSPHPSQKSPATILARRSARHHAATLADLVEERSTNGSVFDSSSSQQGNTLPSNLCLPPSSILSSVAMSSTSLTSRSSSDSITRPVPRKSSAFSESSSSFLPFVPLTPILASPSVTPEPGPDDAEGQSISTRNLGAAPGHGHMGVIGVAYNFGNEVDGVPMPRSSGGRNEAQTITPVIVHEHLGGDCKHRRASSSYSSKKGGSRDYEATPGAGPSLPLPTTILLPPRPTDLKTPMWTSTPPTPPLNPDINGDAIFSAHGDCGIASSPVPDSRGGIGPGKRRGRTSQPPPASVSLFPQPSTAPSVSSVLQDSPSIARSKTTLHRGRSASQRRGLKRRQSLSPNFGKPKPPLSGSSVVISFPASSLFSQSAPTTATQPSSSLARSASRSRSRTRRALDLERSELDERMNLCRSFSRRSKPSPTSSGAPRGGRNAKDPREVRSEDGHTPLVHSSDSMVSFRPSSASPTRPRSPNARRMFHLGGPASEDDAEDDYEDLPQRAKPAAAEEMKETKRFHALMELLQTEVGYLKDLRAFVTIYLAQLPSITVCAPPPSLVRPSPSLSISSLALTRSFPSSRSTCVTTSQNSGIVPGVGPPTHGPDVQSNTNTRPEVEVSLEDTRHPPEQGKETKKDQDDRRPLLSEHDIQLVSRNAQELLTLHEEFVAELKEVVGPLGYEAAFARPDGVDILGEDPQVGFGAALRSVGVAVKAVSEVFIRRSSSFGAYEQFCPWHNEAANMTRSLQDHYPIEWDAYEARCSLLVTHAFELSSQRLRRKSRDSVISIDESPPSTPDLLKPKRRRHSTPTLGPGGPPLPAKPLPSSESNHPDSRGPRDHASSLPSHVPSQVGRLKFADYLIKPVQRICKYPLLLDQLKVKSAGWADIGLEKACATMRAVVALVDDASMKQARTVKSALALSRVALSLPSVSPSSPEERPTHLTMEFLNTLGVCLVSGALDIVQHPSSRARYLGTFLYVGGYMVLVKITKGSKVYEPKLWFSLIGFEVLDAEEDDAAFPYSFHLYGQGHHLQLAAACQLEKDIWVAAIREAMSEAPEWKNEPLSSLHAATPTASPVEDEHHEFTVTPLPTIQSLSELESSDATAQPAPSISQTKSFKTLPRVDSATARQDSQSSGLPLTRRSSTASVKAFFAPLSFDTSTKITRPSSQVRQQVNHALHDVFSDNCLNARAQAQMREEELFHLRKRPGPGISRSNSGLSLTNTIKRRYDSVLVSARRKGSVDGHVNEVMSDPENTKQVPIVFARRTLPGRRRHNHALSLVPSEASVPLDNEGDGQTLSPSTQPESPSPMSHCSSTPSSSGASVIPSPTDKPLPLPTPPAIPPDLETFHPRTNEHRPKRARSMVENVRYFFHSRSVSPTPSGSSRLSSSPAVSSSETGHDSPGGLVQWWRKGSLRRRVRSSPDVPTDESPLTTPAQSSDDSHGAAHLHSLKTQQRPSLQVTDNNHGPPPSPHSLPPTPRRVSFRDTILNRHRSLHVPSSREESKANTRSESAPTPPRRSLKNVFFFRSSASITPLDANR